MNRETIQKDNTKVTELLNSMDVNIAQSFNYKQRKALNKSLNMRDWRKHSIDFRPTIALPLFPWSFYLVFLAGANKRELTNGERFIAFFMFFVVIFMFGLLAICVGLISIYLLKSWLGIDLFPNESLGLWDQFKAYLK
jgi:hypothetical protein